MYQALYRKYRPNKFKDVVGQDVIIKTLGNAIKNNKVSHAYLFSGPRGTGKTSIAKVFAKMLNCNELNELEPCNKCVSCTQINNNQDIDILEIDAASNNGVDEIRELRNKINLVPTNSKYKIYIIDEVHMLTNQAFNALLKTLEEPPAHVIFIFATTEYYKIPKTILSRCQRFDFKKVSNGNIIKKLKKISELEQIKITDDAIKEIAILSDGGLRDAISLLDQVNSYVDSSIDIDSIHEINGTITEESIESFLTAFFNKDMINVLNQIESFEENSKDMIKIVQEIIETLKNILISINTKEYITNSNIAELSKLTNGNELYRIIKNFSLLISEMKKTNNVKTLFEIEIIKNIDLTSINETTLKKEIKVELLQEEPIKKEEIKEQKKLVEEENSILKELDNLKKIRINNSLLKVSKKERDEFNNKIEELRPLLLDPKYSRFVSLILDGTLKALTNENFILMYKTTLLANEFNMLLEDIESMLKEIYNISYKPIAVSSDEWEEIKEDYNKNKVNYKYQEEPIKKEENETAIIEDKNDIEEIFNDIIEYS